MLQISTGKFFRPVELYTTRHRGVLFSNYRVRQTVVTVAGTLYPLEASGDLTGLLYEADERLEAIAPDGRREFLVSVGGDYMLQDFAAVASFSLGITCTPDIDLARRLTQATRLPLGVPHHPRAYVSRVFDTSVESTSADAAALQSFVSNLVGLERRTYEAALRSIRRYVTGLHRFGDDLDLAYTLFVASLESLAQSFDAPTPEWEDYDVQRRAAIDAALTETTASHETQHRVRAAILAREHIALSRRYRAFVLEHLGPSFYRGGASHSSPAARRRDLPGMLDRAYRYRSQYVHELRELPRIVTTDPSHGDVVYVDGEPVLTFAGLSRVVRHVILTFVERSPKVEFEDFNYRKALPNLVRMPLAESFWLGSAQGYSHHSANRYLSGFLNQLAAALAGVPGAALTNLVQVMEKIEALTPGLSSPAQRLPMLVLYGLYNRFIEPAGRRPEPDLLLTKYDGDFGTPSVESMIAHSLLSPQITWPPHVLAQTREAYYTQRRRGGGLRLPPIFEAAVTLSLAEAYRLDGDEQSARRFISEAVEDLPGHARLIALEAAALGAAVPVISWQVVLLPPPDPQ
jgi:hypothetical protein